VFSAPAAWSRNFALGARIRLLSPSGDESESGRVIDGQPASTWTANSDRPTAAFVLDLGGDRCFDRVVVFNRQSDQRGTGGGNNAVKRIGLSAATSDSPGSLQVVGEYVLEGPAPVCFKRKAGGQVCVFIDRTEPNVLTLPATCGRYVKAELQEAFWTADANQSWERSIAISEIMLFDSRGGR
jgi:hypothetical protein